MILPPGDMNSLPPMSPGNLPVDASAPPSTGAYPPLGALPYQPQLPEALQKLQELAQLKNAAESELIDERDLGAIAHRVYEGYQIDIASRTEWEEQAERAMKAAKQKREPRNYPFPNSSNVRYPLIATAALQFNARAYPALCPGRDVVKTHIGGADQDGQKASRGARISQFMSHQIVDGMPSWQHEMDVMTYQLPIIGSAFKKAFWDPDKSGPTAMLISAFDLVVNSCTKSLEECPRITHRYELYPYQIEERQRAKTWLDVDLSAEYDAANDEQAPIRFLEQHCYYDLDGDGYDEPWIVTIAETSQQLVRIVAGFDPLDVVHDTRDIIRIPRDEYFVAFDFLPDPSGGFYGIGFGHLLDSFGEVIDTSFNQMLDAGHLQNAGGGFIGSGLDFQSENEEFRFEPGKYWYVNAEQGDIKGNIVTMDHPGPSPVLFQMLGMMMESAKQMTSIQDIMTGAASAQTMQPTTLMALIDQGMKVFTAIYKRIYDALGREFRIQYRLNQQNLKPQAYQSYLGLPADPSQDFADDGAIVTPVADPSAVTMMQQMAKASFLMQISEHPKFGPLLDDMTILRRLLEAASIDGVGDLIKKPQPPGPQEQIALETALANIDKLKSEAERNRAASNQSMASADNQSAQAADKVLGHQPLIMPEPGGPGATMRA
jgi:chaperonin GroES